MGYEYSTLSSPNGDRGLLLKPLPVGKGKDSLSLGFIL